MKKDNHNEQGKKITRRGFLKVLGASSAVVAAGGLMEACNGGKTTEAETSPQEPPKGQMTYRTNHNTNDKVSILGFGMMRLPVVGGALGASGREDPDAPLDQEMINRQIDYALEHGINYFDTSPAYCKGRSEEATGIALARHKRTDYFIATKLSNFAPETWPEKESKAMFEQSLKYLQTDYVDYLLLHSVGGGDDCYQMFNQRYMDNGILDWLVEQKKKGRIRNLGFSFHGDQKIFDMLLKWMDEGKYHWDFVQIEMNYLDWEYAQQINDRNVDAKYLYEELTKRNIPAVVMEPLLGGRLANLPDRIVEQMKRREPDRSVASWAFRFCGTFPNVLTSLSGMTYMEHLKDNLLSHCPLKPLTDEELKFLANIAKQVYDLKNIPCTGCQYCMPCPYGIDIPSIFAHYNKCIKEGNLARNSKDEEYARMRRAFLIGYDRSVPKLRQALHCIGCNQCSPHCPQRIHIPEQMQMVNDYVEKLKQETL